MRIPQNAAEVAFGQLVRRRRSELKISQEELAHRANLHRTFVSQLERGKKRPTLTSILSLIGALEMRMPAFFECLDQYLLEKYGGEAISKGSERISR